MPESGSLGGQPRKIDLVKSLILKHFGFHNDALDWVFSYLSNRKQKVRTDTDSQWEFIQNGVPQGSILGPLLFTVLVSDISENITTGN